MSATSTHLAIDLGASGGRVIAGSLIDQRLHLEALHRFANDPVFVQSSMQWDVLGLWREVEAGLTIASRKIQAAGGEIASAGVDTWGVDYVLLGGDDLPVAPAFHYRDRRNRGMLERAFDIVPRQQIFAATGLQFMEFNTLYQLLASKHSGSAALEVADGMLLMADFFHWLLTGQRSIEFTNASTTQILDPRTGNWAWELIDAFQFPRHLFTDVTQPGTVLGALQSSIAQRTGLHDVPVVLPATHDTASAVLAVPADSFAQATPDWCYISSGTWSLMGVELPRPLINDRCAELNFTNEGGIFGSTRLLKNIGGLWVFQQIRAAMVRRGTAVSWQEMVHGAEQTPPFSLVIDPDHPDFLAPEDMVDAINGFARRTGQLVPGDSAVLFRAALEGLALRYRICLEMLESLVGGTINTIYVVGGGSLNELLCQMTADACGRTVIAGPAEATATGNVLMQMLGTGRLSDVRQARQLVRHSVQPQQFQPRNTQAWAEPLERFRNLG